MEPKGVVFEGKTLDDAVKKGLQALGLSRAEVMIHVEEEGSGGFLGLGARPYHVRMMPLPRREAVDRGERPERRGRDGRDRGERRGERGGRGPREARGGREGREGREGRGSREGREAREGREVRESRAPREARRGREPRERDREHDRNGRGRQPAPAAQEVRPASGPTGPPPAEAGDRERADRDRDERDRGDRDRAGRRRRRGRRGGDRPRPADVAGESNVPSLEASDARAMTAVREPRGDEGPPIDTDELVANVRRLSEDLFKAMGFEARVEVVADGDTVAVRAEVPADGELLTGEKGEVRQAIQHLLNRMLNRGQVSRYHVQLEINDFWRHRETELQELARRLADEALADQTEKLTEYLNAQERRIVHVSLREDTRVRTYAIGDGLIKKVAIAPAEASEEPKQDD